MGHTWWGNAPRRHAPSSAVWDREATRYAGRADDLVWAWRCTVAGLATLARATDLCRGASLLGRDAPSPPHLPSSALPSGNARHIESSRLLLRNACHEFSSDISHLASIDRSDLVPLRCRREGSVPSFHWAGGWHRPFSGADTSSKSGGRMPGRSRTDRASRPSRDLDR